MNDDFNQALVKDIVRRGLALPPAVPDMNGFPDPDALAEVVVEAIHFVTDPLAAKIAVLEKKVAEFTAATK